MDYTMVAVLFGTLITSVILDWIECSIVHIEEGENHIAFMIESYFVIFSPQIKEETKLDPKKF